MDMLTPEMIARLTAPERLTLIGELWDSLADSDWPVTAAQARELDRRMASFDDDRARGISWDQLKAELQSPAQP